MATLGNRKKIFKSDSQPPSPYNIDEIMARAKPFSARRTLPLWRQPSLFDKFLENNAAEKKDELVLEKTRSKETHL